jgi:hypothetical protein
LKRLKKLSKVDYVFPFEIIKSRAEAQGSRAKAQGSMAEAQGSRAKAQGSRVKLWQILKN